MADRIVCACVSCPKCGSWVVLPAFNETGSERSKMRTSCPAPDCDRAFEFDRDETRTFELPLALFERRHFYRSELRETGT
jgi:hypothetical protein